MSGDRYIRRWGMALAGFLLLAWGGARGQEIPQPMSPPRLVNDFAGLFSEWQRQQLEDSLLAFDALTSTQIAVVTVADLGDYPAAEFATRLMEQWGVGTRKYDNGIVLLLKPRNEVGAGEVFIAVGYGLEGALPDILAARIIDERMVPYLSADSPNYYAAAVYGTAAIREAVRGEYTAEEKEDEEKRSDWQTGLLVVVVLVLWIVLTRFLSRWQDGSDDDSGPTGGRGFGRGVSRPGFPGLPNLLGGLGGLVGRSGGLGGFGGFGGGRTGGGGAGRRF